MIKQHIYWDITLHLSKYPDPIKKVFNEFYFKERRNFVTWIDNISLKFSKDIDWWVSSPPSRNLYYSDLYKHICILKTLTKLKKKYTFTLSTNSRAFKSILRNSFSPKMIDIKIKISKKLLSKNFYYLYVFKNILHFTIQYFLIRILTKKRSIPNNSILVDTFVIDKKNKEKFYYGNLKNHAKKQNKDIFFLPTIIEKNIIKLLSIIISLKKEKNFILKENYLNFIDLIYCFIYSNRIKKFNLDYKKFENFDLSELIKEEIFYNRNLFSVFIGLSNFCFFKNLKLKSIKIKKLVNWFENQPFDKGLNLGLRRFFPNTISLGYQGFTDYPEYMNIYPSNVEFNSNVIPKKIIVCGEKYINLRKEFCKKLKIFDGPALRFEDIFIKNKKRKKKFNIVIFLEGASKEIDKDVILKFIRISKNFPNLKFYIKAHPILPIKKLNIKLPKKFIELNKKFSFIANNANICVAYGNTSATLESLAYGCKLILPFDNLHDITI